MEHVMNITQKISLSLLMVALGAPSAFAALSGDSGGNAETGIELSGDDTPAQRRIDQMLAVKVLDETVLQRHAKSSVRAPAPMGGHYDREGADAPQLFGQQDFTRYVSSYRASSEAVGDSTGLAQMTAVHMVGSGDVTGPAPLMSVGASAATQTQTYVFRDKVETPLPPSLLLLASGLFGLSAARPRLKQAC